MKLKRIIIALLVVLLCLGCLPVQATEDNTLKIERAVMINDKQIVIEFSEPVAFNFHEKNRGPHIAVRLIDALGRLIKFTKCDILDPYYGMNMQWNGTHQFVDSKHDRIIWTISDRNLGMENIRQIIDYQERLAPYKDKNRVVIVIEEVPYDTNAAYTDNTICNITTADGKHYLTPLMPDGWERTNTPLTIDYSYRVDPSKFESVEQEKKIPNPLAKGNGVVIEDLKETEEPTVTQVVKNNSAIAAGILGGGIVLSVGLAALVIGIKKRKAA